MFNKENENEIYTNVRNTFINQGVVFFGGYAISLYSNYMPKHLKNKVKNIADFDVLSTNPLNTAEIVKERLTDIGVKNAKIIKRESVGEIIPEHYEVLIGKDTIAFIYKPIACHSYNTLNIKGQQVKIATIDTMLSFYLAFLYTNRSYYNQFLDRIICMSNFLFDVQQKNRLSQKGLLKRFSITCYGHQESVEEIRSMKADKYKELKLSKNKKEYEEWFLNYKPDVLNNITKDKNVQSQNILEKTVQNKPLQNKTIKKKKTKRNTKYSFFGLFKNKKIKKSNKNKTKKHY